MNIETSTNVLALSIEQVQSISGLGRTKLYELINTGELPARKLGRRTLILRKDLDVFLETLPSYSSQEHGGLNG